MNRRNAVKNVLAIGVLSITGFTGYRFYRKHREINVKEINGFKELIAELAEIIIPETDTPGAKQANVQDFIINVLVNCSTIPEQNIFLEGLYDVEDLSISRYEKSFLKCSVPQRIDVIKHFETQGIYSNGLINKINQKVFGQSFFTKLKSLTVIGYCNSLQGATIGLAYDYIPGAFQSCIPIKPNQKSWATK